jgi:hypothetical protein
LRQTNRDLEFPNGKAYATLIVLLTLKGGLQAARLYRMGGSRVFALA